MEHPLRLYNTLTKSKEKFVPLNSPFVGLYVCGPTVYGDPHLGHARPAITYDILFRYLRLLDYKVRYVRNITDVGHLEADADEGEDKISKKAKLEALEPMEVVQQYTNSYHKMMDRLNVLRPSIEPKASGHIPEQIEYVEAILKKGFAYEANGSVYFDVDKYNQSSQQYGKLSGRNVEELLNTTRQLDGQKEKRKSYDFALWKNASPEHLMRWNSPWGVGFPGWHLECSVMSTKYLGETFDIHGGGLDLLFPHHECEIAQSVAATGHETVRYWMHNNMITVNGKKMGKSLGNFINLDEFFNGSHEMLDKAYSPMTIRFFILQAQYRSTIDFSNEALLASEKGYHRLMEATKALDALGASGSSSIDVKNWSENCYQALNDDINTPILIAHLFDAVKWINSAKIGEQTFTAQDLEFFRTQFNILVNDILGLLPESDSGTHEAFKKAMDLLLQLRSEAKQNKDWATSDKIRDELASYGFEVKDTKDGFEWTLNK